MVLKEIEHPGAYAVDALPAIGDGGGGMMVTLHSPEGVVEVDLVIQVIEMALVEELPVLADIVNLGDEHDVGIMGLDLGDGPFPELDRNHEHHVTPEAVYAFRRPGAS